MLVTITAPEAINVLVCAPTGTTSTSAHAQWGGPYLLSIVPRPSSAELTLSVLHSRDKHAFQNPCFHAKWDGDITCRFPNGTYSEMSSQNVLVGTRTILTIRGMTGINRIIYPGESLKGEGDNGFDTHYTESLSWNLSSLNYRWTGTSKMTGLSDYVEAVMYITRQNNGRYDYLRSVTTWSDARPNRITRDSTGSLYWPTYVPTGLDGNFAKRVSLSVRGAFSLWTERQGAYSSLDPFIDPEKDYFKGNATQNAVNGFKAVESNMIANVKESSEWGSTIPNVVKDVKELSKESVADAWLNYRYGDRLTAQDAKQYIDSLKEQILVLQNQANRKSYGSASTSNNAGGVHRDILYCCEIFAQNGSGLDDVLRRLDELGSLPSVERVWDLVPYSFVVDWFVNVGQCANIIDSWFALQRMDITCCVQSTRGVVTCDSDRVYPGSEGQLKMTMYDRYLGSPALPMMDLDHLASTPSWKNILDGASLLVTK